MQLIYVGVLLAYVRATHVGCCKSGGLGAEGWERRVAAAEARPARAWQYAGSWLLGKMESKTLLLDLVQQRKDGRITQEEMVRQLVELRNQADSIESAIAATADSSAFGVQQLQQRLAAMQAHVLRMDAAATAGAATSDSAGALHIWASQSSPASWTSDASSVFASDGCIPTTQLLEPERKETIGQKRGAPVIGPAM